MEISIEVSNLYVEPHGRNGVYATIEVDAQSVADELPDDVRLHDLDVDVVREWLLKNDNHDDILEAIGEDKIHEFLSHSA